MMSGHTKQKAVSCGIMISLSILGSANTAAAEPLPRVAPSAQQEITLTHTPAAPAPGKGCKWVNAKARSGGATFPKQRSQDPSSVLKIPGGASYKIEKRKTVGWVRVLYKGQIGWTD